MERSCDKCNRNDSQAPKEVACRYEVQRSKRRGGGAGGPSAVVCCIAAGGLGAWDCAYSDDLDDYCPTTPQGGGGGNNHGIGLLDPICKVVEKLW